MTMFETFQTVTYEGADSDNPLAFRHYDAKKQVMGKSLEEHLRFAVAYWHSFAWEGGDPFGGSTFQRDWHPQNSMENAFKKADAAFDFFRVLDVPYFCWHDLDLRPDQGNFADNLATLDQITDYLGEKMEQVGTKLLWGTANMFSERRWMSGASTNPDPDVFAFAAATVKSCMDATHKMGGENYVLWGGREGYETLLNTNMGQELDHMGRFLNMVVDYKHKIGFKGAILVEPKPQEPSKHQYDFDAATCIGFLRKYGLENEVKLNLEQGHAILAGHSFEHEIAVAAADGMLGSIDMNRNDYQSGWDTDQFPNNTPEVALCYYHILKAGGLGSGGTNFDAKVRRQSLTAEDLIAAHVGGMDICARGLEAAAAMLEDGGLEDALSERYAGWETPEAQAMLESDFESIAARVVAEDIRPEPKSGRQEILENYVNRFV
ncbi:xylose isomerase [Cognatishimia activa]|uniref:Xylose isomerase n=1 Tax=Cognatishimia activa TaxID=1715691 RepID=A0A0P1IPQ0_9RHOB|nr:xylose isomerase [Cognatishimia activa]MEE2945794.1 xylose isomerase [Pseudomonadota bacterium]CUI86637.1 Xylose isomerase [Cognatishimia activa]CUK25588.1 Xylose isomerase [Cognatishimia activa]